MIYKNRKRQSSTLELIKLSPNLVTLLAICFGLFAIKFSFQGKYIESAFLVILAAFFDAIDGRLARFLNSSTSFGAQLDSLADFVNFGVTPGFVIYNWICSNPTDTVANCKLAWPLVLLFAICAAIRLARFNVGLENKNKNDILDKYFFIGIAAPGGAGLAMLPIVMTHEFGPGIYSEPCLAVIFAGIIALLMSSRIPTLSIKRIPIKNEYLYSTLVFLGLILVGLIVKTWVTLTILGILYILSIPVTSIIYLKICKKYKKQLIR